MARFRMAAIHNLIFHEEGAELIEYALVLALIVLVCLVAAVVVSAEARSIWSSIASTL